MIGALVLITWILRNFILNWLDVYQGLLLMKITVSKLWERVLREIIGLIIDLRLKT